MARLPPKNYKFFRSRAWGLLWVGKEVSCGPSGIRWPLSMSGGGLALHHILSSSNAFVASRTRVNRSNTSFGMAFRLEGHGGTPPLSCTNFVGAKTWNCDSCHWKHVFFGWRVPKKCVENIKIWHLLRGITLWTIWIEWYDDVFNQEQWHESKAEYHIGDDLIMYTMTTWEREGCQVCEGRHFFDWGILQGFKQS